MFLFLYIGMPSRALIHQIFKPCLISSARFFKFYFVTNFLPITVIVKPLSIYRRGTVIGVNGSNIVI